MDIIFPYSQWIQSCPAHSSNTGIYSRGFMWNPNFEWPGSYGVSAKQRISCRAVIANRYSCLTQASEVAESTFLSLIQHNQIHNIPTKKNHCLKCSPAERWCIHQILDWIWLDHICAWVMKDSLWVGLLLGNVASQQTPLKLIWYLSWAFKTKAVSEAHGKTMIPWWQNCLAQGDDMPSNIHGDSGWFWSFLPLEFAREIYHSVLSSNIMARPENSLTDLLQELPCNGPFVLETECGHATEYSIQLHSTLQNLIVIATSIVVSRVAFLVTFRPVQDMPQQKRATYGRVEASWANASGCHFSFRRSTV